ncbi:uncharacterized protein LOC111700596 [Eurytemora carolleeae]|uniref:uncharacterized protein LOC111700596 n=1 Tax=Eurytemora carolleeae TaxID=1294199 RepID=UPI000C781D1F|nr:uncharacterized protein LOC111700596 [Eurytemora carolleeae]XP_023327335.1 uncharacterized protein LOC111700596 [Eurytemora carolleeae]|eukprot:XP_023327333.1 uncharacterized protein LOC111700596 [Eurytemora affinis]
MFPPAFIPRSRPLRHSEGVGPQESKSLGRDQLNLERYFKSEEQRYENIPPIQEGKYSAKVFNGLGRNEFTLPPPVPAGNHLHPPIRPSHKTHPHLQAHVIHSLQMSHLQTARNHLNPSYNLLSAKGGIQTLEPVSSGYKSVSPRGRHSSPSFSYLPSSPSIPCFPPPPSPSLSFCVPPPSPSLSYFSSRPSNRPRTLIEIPRQDSEPQESRPTGEKDETSSMGECDYRLDYINDNNQAFFGEDYLNLKSAQYSESVCENANLKPSSRPITFRRVSVAESTLDPNSRPFTPSTRAVTSSLSKSEPEYSGLADHNYNQDSCSIASEEYNFLSDLDPLPQDPSSLLPLNLVEEDAYSEDENNNNNCLPNLNLGAASSRSNRTADRFPPLVPDAAWKIGCLRSNLLPTPVNFPPFGHSKLEPVSIKSIFSGVGTEKPVDNNCRLLVSGVEEVIKDIYKNSSHYQMFGPARRIGNKATSNLSVPVAPPQTINFSPGDVFAQDLSVPEEYLVSSVLRQKIRTINIRQEHTDLLFFLFYSSPGDCIQLVAASLLYERGWRFHKQNRIWLARWPGVSPDELTSLHEVGLYQYFDIVSWKRIPARFRLEYCHLAEKTLVPEDLKTLYSRYAGVLHNIQDLCTQTLDFNRETTQINGLFQEIDGIKFLQCIL